MICPSSMPAGMFTFDLALFILHALAAAVRAGVFDDLPRTAANRAGRNIHHLAQRGALYGLHLPCAAAMGTGFGVRALFGARAPQEAHASLRPMFTCLVTPFIRLLQVDGDIHPQAAPAPGPERRAVWPPKPPKIEPKISSNPPKPPPKPPKPPKPPAGACAAGRLGEGIVAHRIVLAALFRIAQYAVRFIDLFKLFLRLGRLVSLCSYPVIFFLPAGDTLFNVCL